MTAGKRVILDTNPVVTNREEGPVGTVDKFQGQEAAVVFFSMATSSGDSLACWGVVIGNATMVTHQFGELNVVQSPDQTSRA